MKFPISAVIIIVFLPNISLICGISGESIVRVTTKNGPIDGQRKVVIGNTFNEFLGVPYAELPIGELRFKKPEPVNNWTTPINATQLPNPCYQLPLWHTFLNSNFSEDCLYLNIWQPVDDYNNNQSKAVLFFIHGGAYLSGSSNEYQFQGQILSTKGDVVLVTHNYRVSTFGFLYTGTDDAPGNMALWDNVLALKWVRDNIGYFGGDPNRVTIFGQSAGSWAVSAHILSPVSRNLYQQAILISLAYISNELANKSRAKQMWLKGAKLIGCANSADTSFNSRIINCMRSANASALASIPLSPQIMGNILGVPEMAMIDGVFLPSSPLEMLKSKNYKKNLSLMLGTVENEGQVVLSLFVPGYGATSPGNFTYNQSYANLMDFVSRVPSYSLVDSEQAARLYFAEISPQNNDFDLLRRTTSIAYGDYYFVCTTKLFAQTVYKYDQSNTNVYEYYYASKLGTSVYSCDPQWMGVCHGADLSPLFGLPYIYYSNYTDAARHESNQVIGFYSHFAKYGYPSPQNGIAWPKYYTLNNRIVKPYLAIETNASYFAYGLKTTQCDYLWKKYIYVKVPNN